MLTIHIVLYLKTGFQVEKNLLVLLNPYAGEHKTRSIYNLNILPILELVNFKIELIGTGHSGLLCLLAFLSRNFLFFEEIHYEAPLSESLAKRRIKMNDYYGVLILAGDRSVKKTTFPSP